MPRTSHHRRPMGGRGNRRSGGGRVAASGPYTLASDPLTLLWWDPTTVSGSVSGWVDKVASVSAAQATGTLQPTASATAIGGAYPGVTSDGGDVLAAAAGAVLSGKTTLTLTAAMVDATAALSIAAELTLSTSANDGGFAIVPNEVAGTTSAWARGTIGYTSRRIGDSLAAVKVVSIGYDFATAGAGAVSFIRTNGVAQALTNVATGSFAGSAANATLYLFGRGTTPSFPWAGTFGDIAIRNSLAQDAALEAAEDFIAARVGLSF